MKKENFSYYLMKFLSCYLPNQSGYSKNTISSYRDCFIVMFEFFNTEKKISVEKIDFEHINKESIIDFLEWLENIRHCSVSTRNQRLSAINSFFSYVTEQMPDYLFQYQQIKSIKIKKSPEAMIEFLAKEEIQSLLMIPDQRTASGLRDLTMLSLLYDTAARVQEICDLSPCDVSIPQSKIQLTGKGNKTRIIPIMDKTSKLLKAHIYENKSNQSFLFPNRQGQKITRAGVTYILKKYIKTARVKHPNLFKGNIHPHCLRHSRAMHMIESGLPIYYIRDFLGHESVKTTEIYARTTLSALKQALEKTHQYDATPELSWNKDRDTLDWLRQLGK